jgi:hypothetical protein
MNEMQNPLQLPTEASSSTTHWAPSPISAWPARTVLSGDTAKAKTGYQDFLTLWKDADPDIPLLKQAKGEYEKLQ